MTRAWFQRSPVVVMLWALVFPAPAHGAVSGFRATLSTFIGTEGGLPSAPFAVGATGCPPDAATGVPTCTRQSGHLISYSSSGFEIGAGVFSLDEFHGLATNFSGTVPVPTSPSTIFTLGRIVNQSSAAGSFHATAGPAGGFGGSLSSGGTMSMLYGVAPLPNIFGSIAIPLQVGASGTVTATGTVVLRTLSASARFEDWTTGRVTFNDTNLDPPGSPRVDATPTSGTVTGTNQLGPGGGSISLVSPITIRVDGVGFGFRRHAGYAVLQITFVPEPAMGVMTGVALAALWARRRSHG